MEREKQLSDWRLHFIRALAHTVPLGESLAFVDVMRRDIQPGSTPMEIGEFLVRWGLDVPWMREVVAATVDELWPSLDRGNPNLAKLAMPTFTDYQIEWRRDGSVEILEDDPVRGRVPLADPDVWTLPKVPAWRPDENERAFLMRTLATIRSVLMTGIENRKKRAEQTMARTRNKRVVDHFEWLCRHRVGGETLARIADSINDASIDDTTVGKAVKSTALMIGLPPRRRN
ncbi:MAG: hypothetical protein ACOY3Y_20910 [Acidobacteriota bacterium]